MVVGTNHHSRKLATTKNLPISTKTLDDRKILKKENRDQK